MKTEKFKGTMENAYGMPLAKPIAFEGEFNAYEKGEAYSADDTPSEEDVRNFVNSRLKANARQKSMNDALTAAGITKPTLEGNVDLQIKGMVKSLVASGKYTEEQATTLAKQMLTA